MEEEVKEQKEVVEKTPEEIIDDLNSQIATWKKEYAIKLADFENYKKRKDKELEEFKKYASEKIILKQLEAYDSLERAIETAKEKNDISLLIDGLELIKKLMMDTLKDEGLEEIKAIDEKYDPYLHQALSTENDEAKENDNVNKVLQKGYRLKGKVIRPAMVIVNKKER